MTVVFFAQTMAATVTFVIGALLVLGATRTAWVLEAMAVIAVGAAVFRDFCGAACVYHRVRGLMTRQRPLVTSAAHGC